MTPGNILGSLKNIENSRIFKIFDRFFKIFGIFMDSHCYDASTVWRHPGYGWAWCFEEPPGGVSWPGTKSLKVPDDPTNHYGKFEKNRKITIFQYFQGSGAPGAGRQYRGAEKSPKLMVYKKKLLSSDGRQITFRDSNHLFIEAMDPGNDIFDETGEIRGVPGAHGAAAKKSVHWTETIS